MWQRKSTGAWFVQIAGKKHYLGKDKKAAEKKWHRLLAKGSSPSSHTVRHIVQEYWAWLKANRAATTCERQQPVLESFAQHVTAKLKAEDLRAFHVQKWIDANRMVKIHRSSEDGGTEESDRPLSPTTVGDRIGRIKSMMAWAKRQGYIESNPIADMQRPTPKIREEFVPADRWDELLSHCKDEPFRDLVKFVLLTGARATEVYTLRRSHFRDDEGGKRFVLPIMQSKGRKRSRVIRLQPEAVAIVERRLATRPGDDDCPVFTNSNDNPWTKNAIKTRFERLKRLMKMPGLCLTTLRHSYAHYRSVAGQDPVTVSKLMGHVDTRMLATRYGHLDQANAFLNDAAAAVPFPASTDS